ncbi:M13 family metallopeptidase [Caulobacter mirabilis]|uniref:Peptidase M13 n=1 Tax=Caulobacter mirabilis TaxID=69666 RepID=A0A2D2ATH1_9CAUL|nr:M13-type metalloendopeptidase [Caulobacter mirabilis]ATQ41265.1 peptidase M13 [Caulobacter mirabilis]
MKRVLLSAAAALALTAAAGVFTFAHAAEAAATTTAAATDATKAARMGVWGFDLSGMDRAAKPGDDFVRFSTGKYLDQLTIPSDRASWGSFNALAELSNNRTKAIIETAAASAKPTGEAQQIGGLYKSFMDEAAVEKLDAKPLAGDLAAIKAAGTREAIAQLMGASQGRFGGAFFGSYIWQDAKAPTQYAVYTSQGGLGLPDRDYYLDAKFADKKTAYRAYVAKMLTMAGWANPEKAADSILALETEIAQASWTKVEQRDADKTYNPKSFAELETLAPGFPWQAWRKGASLTGTDRIIVGEPSAFTKIAAIYAKTPIETLQAWQAFHTVDQAAPYLSKRFVDANFDFQGKTMSGQPEQRARWKRGTGLVGNSLGEAVGKLYVTAYFPAESKAKMEKLVGDLLVAMKGRIEKLDWMSVETKARAQKKLSTFTVKIGYPDKWRDYSALKINPADLYGNVERVNAFNWAYEVNKLGKPVDRGEWGMFPQTVNAYYNPTMNEIVFPAAILQPPFFDPDADPAINYGGIGAVIGHEISHGFDDQGRKYDADGSLTDWWQPQDATKFEAQTKRLGAQYSAFEPLPGLHVNGDLTMGENIGDLGGILIALDAYHLSLGGKPAPVIDGLTGDQRFFLGFAQIWRSKYRDDAIKQQVVSDPHSPTYFRTYGTVQNVDAWYDAWGVKPGDKMYVKPEDRVRIW